MSRFCQEVMLCAEKGRVRSLVKAVEELTTRRWNEYRAFLQAWGMPKLRPICTNMSRTTIISPTRESQPVSWYHWRLFVSVWFKLLHCCFPGFRSLFVSDSLSAASSSFREFWFVDLEAWSWKFQPIYAPACCEAWCSSSDTQHLQLQLPDSERESRSSGQKLEVAHSCLGCIFDIWMWKKQQHTSIMTFVFREFGSPVGAQSLSWCDILQQLPETAFQTRWRCTAWLRNLILASMLQNNETPGNRASKTSKTPGLLQVRFSPISSWFSLILTFWRYWCAAQVLILLKDLLREIWWCLKEQRRWAASRLDQAEFHDWTGVC